MALGRQRMACCLNAVRAAVPCHAGTKYCPNAMPWNGKALSQHGTGAAMHCGAWHVIAIAMRSQRLALPPHCHAVSCRQLSQCHAAPRLWMAWHWGGMALHWDGIWWHGMVAARH
jgi:hypothetical protein